jgi:5-methylcytosine-specific restriction endonuclease McrA
VDGAPEPRLPNPKRQRFLALRARLSSEQNHRCCYCGIRTNEAEHPDDQPTLEHVIPRSQGGGDTYDNCVMACSLCNNQRAHHFDPEHFAALGVNEEHT